LLLQIQTHTRATQAKQKKLFYHVYKQKQIQQHVGGIPFEKITSQYLCVSLQNIISFEKNVRKKKSQSTP
jgi:hypothetical protein